MYKTMILLVVHVYSVFRMNQVRLYDITDARCTDAFYSFACLAWNAREPEGFEKIGIEKRLACVTRDALTIYLNRYSQSRIILDPSCMSTSNQNVTSHFFESEFFESEGTTVTLPLIDLIHSKTFLKIRKELPTNIHWIVKSFLLMYMFSENDKLLLFCGGDVSAVH